MRTYEAAEPAAPEMEETEARALETMPEAALETDATAEEAAPETDEGEARGPVADAEAPEAEAPEAAADPEAPPTATLLLRQVLLVPASAM